MANSNVVLALDTRRKRTDGSFPIILRLSHKGKTTGLSTGYSVPLKAWNPKDRLIRTSYKRLESVNRTNNRLLHKRSEALEVINRLEDTDELVSLSIKELRIKIEGSASKMSFFSYTESLIQDMIKTRKIGNARSYKNVLREVRKFQRDVDFPFEQLSFQYLKSFEKYYLERGLSENGLAVYTRTIRAILNKAIKDGYALKEHYPFNDYVIRTKPTRKRAIRFEDIQKIIDLKLDKDDPLFHTRNYFLISFYLMGAPFVDLAFLKVENIKGDRLQYTRKKTGKHFDIKINDQLKEILSVYLKGKGKEDFILPIVKREVLNEQYRDKEWAQSRYNKKLKKLAERVGIEENLTSYVSRHSFASLANNKNVPLSAISSMLGHQSIKTTQTYLADLSQDKIDDYNDMITSSE